MHFIRGYVGRLVLAACLAFGVVGVGSAAYAQTVVVEGTHRVDPDTVRSYFAGTTQAQVNQGVKDLSATGMFSNVSARVVGGRVIVTVVESSIILNRVAFEGNSKIKGDVLIVQPGTDTNGDVVWVCGLATSPTGVTLNQANAGTTLAAQYLPSDCHS